MANTVRVQVCYATPKAVTLLELDAESSETILSVLERSGIVEKHPEINLDHAKFGVFGKIKSPDAKLHEGDRIEIYRPLTVDPMEARRRRVIKRNGKF